MRESKTTKKWLTLLNYDAIIYSLLYTVRIEASPYCSSRSLWNYGAFTVSTMAHGRGLNAVIVSHFKYQTQILLSKKKIDTVVTRGIVQILFNSRATLFKPLLLVYQNPYSGAYSLDHYSGAFAYYVWIQARVSIANSMRVCEY